MRSESLLVGHWGMAIVFFSSKEALAVRLVVLLAGAAWVAPVRVRKVLLATERDCSSERTLAGDKLYECSC